MTEEYNEGLEIIESEEVDQASTPAAYDVITYPADFTLEGLVSKYKKGSMIVPGFQRNYVWNIRQASRLIESFLLGLPVPAIFLFTDGVSNEQLVIDGQQRLMTIVYFFGGHFGPPDAKGQQKIFKLTGLSENSPFYEKTYSDLEARNKSAYNQLNDSVLRAFIIKQITPDNNTSAYHIFERLNTGGTQLVGQEIRNCVYHGPFNDMLCSLNEYGNWRKIFGKQDPHKRQKDVELILRFFAFYENGNNYEKPIKDFMSSYMKEKQSLTNEEQKKMELIFKRTCDLTLNSLGEKPFHIWSGLNVAAYDSVFTTLAKVGSLADLRDKYDSLKKDNNFIKGVRSSTTNESVVELRMNLAKQYLA